MTIINTGIIAFTKVESYIRLTWKFIALCFTHPINKLRSYVQFKQRNSKKNYFKRTVKSRLRFWFEDDYMYCGQPTLPQLGITNIDVNDKKSILRISVTLERPGVLIGAQGRTINALEEYLSGQFHKPVKIHIIESIIWK